MAQQNLGFIKMLQGVVSKLEMGALVVTAIGLALLYIDRPESKNVLTIGISVLAGVFFLMGYMVAPPTAEGATPPQAEKKGFMALLGTIIWKVIHIGCAVQAIGLLFYLLHMLGYGQMLLIGTTSLAFAIAFSGISIAQKNENYEVLKGALTRGVPLMIIGGYILYNNWPLPA